MNTIIVYSTKYGTTEKCAKSLAKKLYGEVDLHNLKNREQLDLSKYDKVIIGGSIYMGRIQKNIAKFCDRNSDTLKNKKVGLFICCMAEKDVSEQQLINVFPKEILEKAISKDYFGGEFLVSKMGFFHKFIVKKISKTENDKSEILEENIDRFAENMNKVN